MLSVFDVQHWLEKKNYYTGRVDGDAGPKTRDACISALGGTTRADASLWSTDRLLLAVMQLMARSQLIEVGEIDGLLGPQTRHALEVLKARERGDATAVTSWRDKDHTATRWPTQSSVKSFYGEPGTSLVSLTLPRPMKLAWDREKVIRSFQVHAKIHDAALECFREIASTYSESDAADLGIDLFGGCFNIRRMRGGSSLSMHSWGIAIDFDPERNQLRWGRDRARLARPSADAFWRIWESAGAVSLGRQRNYDWMHVQFARL